uniref:Uncharacterized protein n=1 Tax=Apteryx owenii TaxID=8824 RepID=A0A8B9P1F9_APTOW
ANSRSSPRSCAARGCRPLSPSPPASSSPAGSTRRSGRDPPPLREGACLPRAAPLTCGLRAAACCTRSVTARSAGPSPCPAAMPALHIPRQAPAAFRHTRAPLRFPPPPRMVTR